MNNISVILAFSNFRLHCKFNCRCENQSNKIMLYRSRKIEFFKILQDDASWRFFLHGKMGAINKTTNLLVQTKKNMDKIGRRTFFLHKKMGADPQDDKLIGRNWTKKVWSKQKTVWTKFVDVFFLAWKNGVQSTRRQIYSNKLDEESIVQTNKIWTKLDDVLFSCMEKLGPINKTTNLLDKIGRKKFGPNKKSWDKIRRRTLFAWKNRADLLDDKSIGRNWAKKMWSNQTKFGQNWTTYFFLA